MVLCEKGHFVSLFDSADHTTAASSEVFSMEDYRHATVVIQKGAGSAVTITLEECSSFAGASAATFTGYYYAEETTADGDTLTALAAGTTAGVAISANTTTMLVFEFDSAVLTSGYPYVRIKHTAAGTSQFAAVCILTEPRYGTDTTKTAIV